MSLNSPNVDDKSIIFPNFGQGPFSIIAGKSPAVSIAVCAPNTIDSHLSYVCLLSSVSLLCHVSYLLFLLQFCLCYLIY